MKLTHVGSKHYCDACHQEVTVKLARNGNFACIDCGKILNWTKEGEKE